MKSVIFVLSMICFLLSFANDGYAFRCGGEPIGLYDSQQKVERYCGSPFQYGQSKVYYKNRFVDARTWHYNCGGSDFIYEVSFYDGIVIKVNSIGRGSGFSQCGK